MRLLIAEKPHFARVLREHNLIDPDIEVVFTFGIGLWRYAVPRMSFVDIPFTSYPNSLRPQPYKPRNILLGPDGKPKFSVHDSSTLGELEETLDALVKYLREQMGEYEEIICAVDCDRTGYGSAKQLLDKMGWTRDSNVPVHCLYLMAMDKNSLDKAWSARFDNTWHLDSFAEKLASQQLIKKTFDYWWNANSSVVFSEISKWSGLAASPLISKYELMLICIMADKSSPLSGNEVIRLMDNWEGSGKYRGEFRLGIGSPMSRSAILDSAVERGAMSVRVNDGKNTYSLSSAGRTFVSQLHHKTFDPDLPFRINEWIKSGNYEAMARYIRTVFGRQLRYQRNLGN